MVKNLPASTGWASLMAQTVKRLPAMLETRVRFLGREDPVKKEMAIHSSTLAGKIPWTEEPDRLQSMGLPRVGHDSATSLTQYRRCRRCGFDPWVRKILWRRAWQFTPVFLPGKFHGQRSLIGYTPWGRKESDTTEQLHLKGMSKCHKEELLK